MKHWYSGIGVAARASLAVAVGAGLVRIMERKMLIGFKQRAEHFAAQAKVSG